MLLFAKCVKIRIEYFPFHSVSIKRVILNSGEEKTLPSG